MVTHEFFLDQFIFEIRYAFGHLYFDRCGQCLNDIERKLDGWVTGTVDVQGGAGIVERADKGFRAAFSNEKFDFTALSMKKSDSDMELIVEQILDLWSIIRANLGLNEFLRYGCRFLFLLPTTSIEEAEKIVRKSKFNVNIPPYINDAGLTTKTINAVAILESSDKEDEEYRVGVASIIRSEGMEVPQFFNVNPRILSKKQRDYRIAKLKSMAEYSASPKYAVMLDVDCGKLNPEKVDVESFIFEKAEMVTKTFLPILAEL